LVAYDKGARVAYALAARHRDLARSLVFLESKILGLESDDDATKEYWHFGFHQEADLPELLLAGREREYLSFHRRYAWNPAAITEEDIDEYVRAYSSLGGMRAGFAYYRAFPRNRASEPPSRRYEARHSGPRIWRRHLHGHFAPVDEARRRSSRRWDRAPVRSLDS
jgi:pimeloyl-ACP methyl ester carboxylesterase